MLQEKNIDYLIENTEIFRELAPFLVRALKNNTEELDEICVSYPDAFEILWPSFVELVKTPADFKQNFDFIAQDSLTFAYLLPSLKGLIENSQDHRKAFDELVSEQDFYIDGDLEAATSLVKAKELESTRRS